MMEHGEKPMSKPLPKQGLFLKSGEANRTPDILGAVAVNGA